MIIWKELMIKSQKLIKKSEHWWLKKKRIKQRAKLQVNKYKFMFRNEGILEINWKFLNKKKCPHLNENLAWNFRNRYWFSWHDENGNWISSKISRNKWLTQWQPTWYEASLIYLNIFLEKYNNPNKKLNSYGKIWLNQI